MSGPEKLTFSKGVVVIMALGIVVFSFGLLNGFVADDQSQIVDNILVHSIKNIPAFFGGSTFFNSDERLIGHYYRPIASIVFSAIYTIFGSGATWFHLFQILFHILNAALLFLIFNKFFKRGTSLILALIFLVHPINGESVFYISATQDVLFFFFGILALWAAINLQSSRGYLSIFLFLLLSIFSKETGLLFGN